MKNFSAVLAVFALVLAGCTATTETIKIGTIQPISGVISVYGIQTTNAAKMAVEEINAKGGINGKMVELIVEDDEASPEKTTNAFTKLVTLDKVVGIMGALTSKCTLAITSQAQSEGVPLITPTSTNDTVTDAGDYIFRACYKDSFQGMVVANYAADTLKATTAAILYDVSNDYSKGLLENFKKGFEAKGGTVVAESYNSGDKDFNAQITKIKASNPQVLFIPDYYSTVALIAKQVRAQGITVPMLGADGWDSIAENAGEEVVGSFYSNHYSPDAQDADVQAFVAAYKAKHGETPNALAALGYDATKILLEAIAKAGSTDRKAIRDALALTNGKYVTGNISFDANRNTVKSAVMVELIKTADGKIGTQYAGTVNP